MVQYYPYTAEIFLNELHYERLSRSWEAYWFFLHAYPNINFWSPLSCQNRYSRKTLNNYITLSDNAKTVVLWYETILLHELTHFIDHFISFTGFAFHMYLIRDYLTLMPLLKHFNAHQDIDISAPLLEVLRMSTHKQMRMNEHDYQNIYSDLERIKLNLDVLMGKKEINRRDIKEGWWQKCKATVSLLYQDLECITIGDEYTVLIPGYNNQFLRLSTLFEGRAIANCLRHIIHKFRLCPELAVSEIRRYLNTYYPEGKTHVDYLFILNLLAGIYANSSFCELIEIQAKIALKMQPKKAILLLEQIPVFLSSLTWFALNYTNPISAFLTGTCALENTLAAGKVNFNQPIDLLNKLAIILPSDFDLNAKLQITVKKIQEQREQLSQINDADIKFHFTHICNILEYQLRRRIGFGFISPLALPWNGNPIPFFTEIDWDHFGGLYQCSSRFKEWIYLRELLNKRRCKRDEISAWFTKKVAES